jgi:hypothetical protein
MYELQNPGASGNCKIRSQAAENRLTVIASEAKQSHPYEKL